MKIYKCPECGRVYDPEERALISGCPIEDMIEMTPAHHMPTGEPLLCDGTNWPPVIEEVE